LPKGWTAFQTILAIAKAATLFRPLSRASGKGAFLPPRNLRTARQVGPRTSPEGACGKIVRVELLHRLHEERRYPSLQALTAGIAQDCDDARASFAAKVGP